MRRTLALAFVIGLAASGPALAQLGGAGGGGGGLGGGGGRGGNRGGGNQQGPAPTATPHAQLTDKITGDKLESQVEIGGVVKEIDRATGRVTIAYGAVDELDWRAGVMPFPVTDAKLLDSVTVGQRVRFKVDSHEIYEIRPEAAGK